MALHTLNESSWSLGNSWQLRAIQRAVDEYQTFFPENPRAAFLALFGPGGSQQAAFRFLYIRYELDHPDSWDKPEFQAIQDDLVRLDIFKTENLYDKLLQIQFYEKLGRQQEKKYFAGDPRFATYHTTLGIPEALKREVVTSVAMFPVFVPRQSDSPTLFAGRRSPARSSPRTIQGSEDNSFPEDDPLERLHRYELIAAFGDQRLEAVLNPLKNHRIEDIRFYALVVELKYLWAHYEKAYSEVQLAVMALQKQYKDNKVGHLKDTQEILNKVVDLLLNNIHGLLKYPSLVHLYAAQLPRGLFEINQSVSNFVHAPGSVAINAPRTPAEFVHSYEAIQTGKLGTVSIQDSRSQGLLGQIIGMLKVVSDPKRGVAYYQKVVYAEIDAESPCAPIAPVSERELSCYQNAGHAKNLKSARDLLASIVRDVSAKAEKFRTQAEEFKIAESFFVEEAIGSIPDLVRVRADLIAKLQALQAYHNGYSKSVGVSLGMLKHANQLERHEYHREEYSQLIPAMDSLVTEAKNPQDIRDELSLLFHKLNEVNAKIFNVLKKEPNVCAGAFSGVLLSIARPEASLLEFARGLDLVVTEQGIKENNILEFFVMHCLQDFSPLSCEYFLLAVKQQPELLKTFLATQPKEGSEKISFYQTLRYILKVEDVYDGVIGFFKSRSKLATDLFLGNLRDQDSELAEGLAKSLDFVLKPRSPVVDSHFQAPGATAPVSRPPSPTPQSGFFGGPRSLMFSMEGFSRAGPHS